MALPEYDPKDLRIRDLELDLELARGSAKSEKERGFYSGCFVGILLTIFLILPFIEWFRATEQSMLD